MVACAGGGGARGGIVPAFPLTVLMGGGGGIRYKLSGPGGPEGGPGPDCVAYFLSFSVVSSCVDCTTPSDQAQVTLQMRASLSDLV